MFPLLRHSRKAEHRFCQNNLSAYVDGQLTAREQERLRGHLAECETCRADLEALQRTIALLRQLPRFRAPRSFAIPRTAPAPSLPIWLRPWTYGLLRAATGVAALLLVVALAGNVLALPGHAPLWAVSTDLATRQMAKSVPAEGVAEAPTLPEQEGGALQAEAMPEPPSVAAAAPQAEAYAVDTAEPASQPTLTAEEAMRATSAPRGMGGGGPEPSERAPAEPIAAGAAEPADAPALDAPEAVAGAEAGPEEAAPAGGEEWLDAPGVGESEYGTPEEKDTRQPVYVLPQRPRIWSNPWFWWAVGSSVLLTLLLTATLWVRGRRSRWL